MVKSDSVASFPNPIRSHRVMCHFREKSKEASRTIARWLTCRSRRHTSSRNLHHPTGRGLAEQSDEWAEGRRYLGLEVLARCRLTLVPEITEEEVITGLPLALSA